MDLNKDNQDIYTIDRESYSFYMKEKKGIPSSLSSIINILLIVLFLILAYFFYNIIKKDLAFSDVFNKKRFLTTYAFMYENEKIKEKPIVVLSGFKIREEVEVVPEVEKLEVPVTIVEEVKIDAVIVDVKVIEPIELEVSKEVTKKEIIEDVSVAVLSNKESSSPALLSETYLERIDRELNSF